MHKPLTALLVGLVLAHAPTASAQEVTPLDLGMLRNTEVSVVQKMAYSKERRSEIGVAIGLMPFDTATWTPLANGTFTLHRTETFGLELSLGGGYGLKTGTYKDLEGPAYGIAFEAYRFLGRAGVAVEWSPVYAKMNWRGQRILHHDVFGILGATATLEQCVLPGGSLAVGPGATVGVGARVFRGERANVRLELRDDIFAEKRDLTSTIAVKQNVWIAAGLSWFSKGR
ncbi:MAG: outer membrane beta-barrel domain-containing protein [Deltaproteobacteria bacterium]|nr:outer membrane beta-barrel domain-containing protein [Deltaproteobacteria bacterium]